MAYLYRRQHRRLADSVLLGGARAVRQQQLRRLVLAVGRRGHQRGVAAAALVVHLRAARRDEGGDAVELAVAGGEGEGGVGVLLVLAVDVRAARAQLHDPLLLLEQHRVHQRRDALRCDGRSVANVSTRSVECRREKTAEYDARRDFKVARYVGEKARQVIRRDMRRVEAVGNASASAVLSSRLPLTSTP
eukprot:6660906-Pyramimonas_sp.AAC.3